MMVVLTAATAFAQNNIQREAIPMKVVDGTEHSSRDEVRATQKAGTAIWSSDFSDESLWSLGNLGNPDQDWEITTAGPTGFFSVGMGAIASTTAGNGFALFDSDAWGNDLSVQDAWIGNATAIDLSLIPNVRLSFEHYYRAFQGDCFVEFSSNGTDWTSVQLAAEIAVNSSTDNPRFDVVDCSAFIGGEANAFFRFRYIGGWDYAWMVDDVQLLETPLNDLALDFSVLEHVGRGFEYARIPSSQIDELTYSAQFFNFGVADQNNSVSNFVLTDENAVELVNTTTDPQTLMAGDTVFISNTFSNTWEEGLYTAEFTVSSDEDQDGGGQFGNNTDTRFFAIDDALYALDGVDVYPASLSSIGTNSFDGEADGLVCMTQYTTNQELEVYGIEIGITTTSVEGAGIVVGLVDTTNVFADAGSQDDWFVVSEEYEVTADDITNQFIRIPFEDSQIIDPSTFYAAVELSSFSNSSDVRILDDVTVPQPFDASMIFLGNDQATFSNGNAFLIRLITAPIAPESVTEITADFAGALRPNPATDVAQFDYNLTQSEDITIIVTDALGREVSVERLGQMSVGTYTHTLNLQGLAAGLHNVTIRTQTAQTTSQLSVVK